MLLARAGSFFSRYRKKHKKYHIELLFIEKVLIGLREKTYGTGEIAKLLQITKRTLRFYDQIGLLTPSSLSEGGHRIYTEEEIEKLYKIRLLKALGLNLKQVKLIFEESTLEWEDLLQQQLEEIENQMKKYKLMQEIILVVQRSIKLEGKMDWDNLFRYLHLLYETKPDARQIGLINLFTEEELDFLEKHLPRIQDDDPRTQEFIELFAEIKADENRDPASEKAKAWAKRFLQASDRLFAGREELREKLWRIQKEAPELITHYPVDNSILDFIETAVKRLQ
ncbi:MerR family transcriptional regulator [Brevibacillus reuszeri]|uniref:MerR family transcriptional regulator n=1 Tax=Brevibacillus reuszeri TaxID=54915 RepID=UPI001B0C0366|nr:MerR family transcriptional regulator [Brevibacillus reuszeri]GIO10127.1 MerR family transcriptional regulator [Brevibacillus reuszeri]